MTVVVDGFRWALAGGAAPGWGSVALGTASGIAIFLLGFLYFHRTEKSFADVI